MHIKTHNSTVGTRRRGDNTATVVVSYTSERFPGTDKPRTECLEELVMLRSRTVVVTVAVVVDAMISIKAPLEEHMTVGSRLTAPSRLLSMSKRYNIEGA